MSTPFSMSRSMSSLSPDRQAARNTQPDENFTLRVLGSFGKFDARFVSESSHRFSCSARLDTAELLRASNAMLNFTFSFFPLSFLFCHFSSVLRVSVSVTHTHTNSSFSFFFQTPATSLSAPISFRCFISGAFDDHNKDKKKKKNVKLGVKEICWPNLRSRENGSLLFARTRVCFAVCLHNSRDDQCKVNRK